MDESKTNTLPDPELNPLLNPVLAAHMGRWAEVYFTTPAEKRDQAVAELIQELKNKSYAEAASVQMNDREPSDYGDQTGLAAETSFPPGLLRSCSVCGHQNSDEQNFCGMCGTALQISPELQAEPEKEAVAFQAALIEPDLNEGASPERSPSSVGPSSVGPSGAGSFLLPDSHKSADESVADSHFHDRIDNDDGRRSATWSETDLPGFALEAEPVPYRSRLYVGVALTILLTLLVYMAWRGTKAISSMSGTQAVSSKALPPAPAQTAQPTAQPTPTTVPRSAREDAPERALPAKKPVEISHPKARTSPVKTAAPVVTKVTKPASSAPVATDQSGAEEFATAEKYLNGTLAGARNSREAATWLWKAVGKGNVTATMALSDLYLRGDGVSKSCDQARLLLDAAARKGSKAAGERLRNLRAFGCE